MKNNHIIEDIYQLTPVQKGMLFHCLYDSELSLYFFSISLLYVETLN